MNEPSLPLATAPQRCEVTLTTRCGGLKGVKATMNLATLAECIRAAVTAAATPGGPLPEALTLNITEPPSSRPPGPVSVFAVIRVSAPVRRGEDGTVEVDQAAVQSALLGTLMGSKSKVTIPLQ